MSSDATDDLVTQFMAFTGCEDGDKAQTYLEMSGMNVEVAVGLYMEHSHSGLGGGASGSGLGEVRAADPTRRMRLMDEGGPAGMMMMMDDDEPMVSAFAQAMDARMAVNQAAAADAAAGVASSNMEEKENEKAPGAASLSNMFAPPARLIHRGGGFQGARSVAKDARRWLLVNIQKDSEFSSHALNRDVWRDELVENLIREGFIFWQTMDQTDEGRTFVERYKVYDYPHISIIDPRTGRLLYKKEGWTQEKPLTAEQFAEIAMDFCSRHSFDKDMAVMPNKKPPAKTKPPMNRNMTEHEQMQAVMAASFKPDNGEDDQDDIDEDDDEVEYIMEDDNDDDDDKVEIVDPSPPVVAAPPAPPPPPSLLDQLLDMPVGDEPASGARVQIRMPDSKRLVRKFALSDPVKTIYAFVAQNNEEAKSGGKEFSLMAGFPPKSLEPSIDSTIESCGLSGQAITVRWKD